MKSPTGIIALFVFLVAATFFMAMFNPSFAFFPLLLIFLVGAAFFSHKARDVETRSDEPRYRVDDPPRKRESSDLSA
jgi:hypothetical protein